MPDLQIASVHSLHRAAMQKKWKYMSGTATVKKTRPLSLQRIMPDLHRNAQSGNFKQNWNATFTHNCHAKSKQIYNNKLTQNHSTKFIAKPNLHERHLGSSSTVRVGCRHMTAECDLQFYLIQFNISLHRAAMPSQVYKIMLHFHSNKFNEVEEKNCKEILKYRFQLVCLLAAIVLSFATCEYHVGLNIRAVWSWCRHFAIPWFIFQLLSYRW